MKHAFVMTSFDEEYESVINHSLQIVEEKYYIKTHLMNKPYGEVSDDLFPNIRGMIHCCDFGIGVFFPDSKTKGINANLSVEVGYMLGLNKKICYLKDKKLPALNTDILSKIYTEYKKNENSKGGKRIPTMDDALLNWINGVKDELKIKSKNIH